MFPRSAAPRGRSVSSNNSLIPPPPVPRHYDYNHQRPAGVNRFYAPGPERFLPYEWKPPLSNPPVFPSHFAQTMTNRRKRQNDDYSLHIVKRQRLDSSSHRWDGSHSIQDPLPPCHPDQVLPGSSRSLPGFDRSYLSPHSHPPPQSLAVPESPNSLRDYAKDKLSNQMVELFEACQQQSSDLARKEMIRTQLQQDIQHVCAGRLYLTGSSMNGLGCRSSDADLCLVLTGNNRPDPIHVLSVLQRLFKTLPYVERTQLIRAKVPILRFREKGSDLEFDLNVNNTMGIRNTFLLRSYAYADLRIRPMILVIKKWARHNQINDASKGTLSSYALVLMVLHYLQTLNEPVLPSLQREYPPLQFAILKNIFHKTCPPCKFTVTVFDSPECFNPIMDINMVPEGSKHIPPYVSRNQSSLGELFLGFLKYYATCFRWDKQVISVREARAFPKTNSKEWRNKYICVEEPFERTNVARAVHEKIKFDAIKAQFAESCRMLQQKKDLNSILPVRAIINKEASRR